MKTTFKLINIIFKLIKKTNKLNEKEFRKFKSLISETSHSFGLNIYSKPVENIISGLDNVFSTEDFSYMFYEIDILENKDPFIEFDENGQSFEYSLKTKKDLKIYIENHLLKDVDLEKLNIDLMKLLMDFRKETLSFSDEFSKILVTFCDPNFCDSGTLWRIKPAEDNIEKYIDKALLKLNKHVHVELFYDFFEKEFLEVKTDYESGEWIPLNNIEELCSWFLDNKE